MLAPPAWKSVNLEILSQVEDAYTIIQQFHFWNLTQENFYSVVRSIEQKLLVTHD